MKKTDGNIEYYRGWQIDKNKSPGSLHDKFSDDKIYHGIDWTLNLGMAEAKEMEEEFKKIYESKEQMNEWIDEVKAKISTPDQIINWSLMKDREWWLQNPHVYSAVYYKVFGTKPQLDDDEYFAEIK